MAQKGSLVDPERLRFDISHPKPISEAELAEVEEIANRIVLQNDSVTTRLMAVDDAIESGARALFGEKYGDEVRVVSMGREAANGAERAFSIELCGGTHVARTGDIGLVTVLAESAVAAGVRRIEALTGRGARAHLNAESRRLREIAAVLRVAPEDAAGRVGQVVEERRKLERELGEARRKLAVGGPAAEETIEKVGDVAFLGRAVEGVETKDLKGLVDQQKAKLGSGVVALAVVGDDKRAGLVVGVTADLTARFDAVDLVRRASEALGGKGGGGRPDLAQAGGPDGDRLPEALAAIRDRLAGRA